MAIHFSCECGRPLSIDDSKAGKKGRCPACGAVLKIPDLPPIPGKSAGPLDQTEHRLDDEVTMAPAPGPPAIRTPVWLLYLGLVATSAILWGMLATAILLERSRQVEEALYRADLAEQASKESIARAETIKSRAFQEAEVIRREAKSLREQAEVAREQAEVTKFKEEEKLHKLYPHLRKLVPGENLVKEKYLEAFTLDNGVFRAKFRNTDTSSVQPDFSITFFDKNANRTDGADISWMMASIGPGEASTDEKPIHPMLGQPVYYTLNFRSAPPPGAAASNNRSEAPLSAGDRVILQDVGYKRVFLATDDSAWHDMLNAEVKDSVELMSRLVTQGKVIAVKGGTAAVIVQNGFLSKLVRITEGPHAGREGWIQNELVKPSR
jgi:hypothetical protein